jgi:DNA repair exonuclease SbcCD ATPase subunit
MFKRVRLTNFQRHKSLEVTLGEGLVAIKGANEAGKTTLLRALAYACFGAKALASTLEETVRWGEPVSTLRVELDLEIDGVLYEITRGKSGAQVDYPTGVVTGQNEVTNFVCRLLGMDASTAPHLILSNQTEIRGALESGARATAELIERLADFAQIDELVETMQEELTLGSPVGATAALDGAKAKAAEARADAVKPDVPMLDSRIEDAQELAGRAQAALTTAETALEAASEAYSDARVKSAEHQARVERVGALADKRRSLESRIEKAAAVKAPERAADRIKSLQDEMEEASRTSQTRKVYESVKGFLTTPAEPVWAGPKADLDQAVLDHAEQVAAEAARIAELNGEIKLLKAALLQGTCTFCGKDFSGVPEVAARNEETRTALEDATIEVQNLGNTAVATKKMLDTLRSVQARCVAPLAALAKHDAVLALDDDLNPPRLKWIGPAYVVSDTELSVVDHPARIATLQREQRLADTAQAQLVTLRAELAEVVAQQKKAKQELAAHPEVQLTDLLAAKGSASDTQKVAAKNFKDAADAERVAREFKARCLADYESAVARLAVARNLVMVREQELSTLAFNNELLKRVRGARPIVADKLWAIVLAAVSRYFSEMRGTPSVVSKAADGFKVDGHAVATLSGSTLDVLGLAIRVALVRTFLPAAQFLVLDEPASGCDGERTVNLLAFVAACGFKQVLLVSHEAVSEEFSNNLVSL